MSSITASWFVVAGLGATVGLLDLVKTCPPAKSALRTPWGLFYILFSGAFSIAALWVYVVLGFRLPQTAVSPEWIAVLAIGIGGLGLLRSTITVHAGGKLIPFDINKLPQSVLDAVINATKAAQAVIADTDIAQIMQGVSFAKSFESLPVYCIQRAGDTMSPAVASQIGEYINLLRTAPMTDEARARLMGLRLANVVGEDALKRAVTILGASIHIDPPGATPNTPSGTH